MNNETTYQVGGTYNKPAIKMYAAFNSYTPIGCFIKDGFVYSEPTARRILKIRKTRGKNTIDLYLEGGARVTVAG